MKLSPAGLAHLKAAERSVKRAGRHVLYDDGTGKPVPLVGNPTLGYGHLVVMGSGWSEAEAEAALVADVATAERAVNQLALPPKRMTQGQFDALVSFAFNVGAGNFQRSRLLILVNNGDMAAAAQQFLAYTKGYVGGKLVEIGGLKRRRLAERALFLS